VTIPEFFHPLTICPFFFLLRTGVLTFHPQKADNILPNASPPDWDKIPGTFSSRKYLGLIL
jgi:hypothetical protein